MIKWFVVLLLVLPRFIYSQIKCLIMNHNKDKYPIEKRYAVVRTSAIWIIKCLRAVMKVNNENIVRENHAGGRIYACNHLSVFEVLCLMALSEKPLLFISKKENAKVPFLATHLKAIDALCIDRTNVRQSLKIAKEAGTAASNGRDVVIFAEGTRSKDGNAAPFKAALPIIVQYSKSEVVLVTVYNTKEPFKFHLITHPKCNVYLNFFEPLPYSFYLENRKAFNEITHDMVQAQLDKYKEEVK